MQCIVNMPLREVKPFDIHQMKQLKENMKRGPTEKQVENLQRAQEHIDKANVSRNF